MKENKTIFPEVTERKNVTDSKSYHCFTEFWSINSVVACFIEPIVLNYFAMQDLQDSN